MFYYPQRVSLLVGVLSLLGGQIALCATGCAPQPPGYNGVQGRNPQDVYPQPETPDGEELSGVWIVDSCLVEDGEVKYAKGSTITIDWATKTLIFGSTTEDTMKPDRWCFAVSQHVTPHQIDLVSTYDIPGSNQEKLRLKGIWELYHDGLQMKLCIGKDRPFEFLMQPSQHPRMTRAEYPKMYYLTKNRELTRKQKSHAHSGTSPERAADGSLHYLRRK